MSDRLEDSSTEEVNRRLATAAAEAHAAEARVDWRAAGDAWRRYRLIADQGRSQDDLLAEGARLSKLAVDLAEQA